MHIVMGRKTRSGSHHVWSEEPPHIRKISIDPEVSYVRNTMDPPALKSSLPCYQTSQLEEATNEAVLKLAVVDAASNQDRDPDLSLVRFPAPRSISLSQLAVEVEKIYDDLIVLEAKCMKVDRTLSLAAQEKDPSKRTGNKKVRWPALIQLHIELLDVHHDLYLACQHYAASQALRRTVTNERLPERLWHYGIHHFIELLRRQLPDSYEYMLTLFVIAYNMMGLLVETVPTLENFWLESLGTLARYRMTMENDPKDCEAWGGIARSWFAKAVDKNPLVGRYHYQLAVLSRQYSLQQLSLYLQSLTCIIPVEIARGGVTLFNSYSDGNESRDHSISLERVFCKAHSLLFEGRLTEELVSCVQQLLEGLLDNYIDRVTAKFKEQGVFVALSNIAGLLKYGVRKNNGASRSVLQSIFEDIRDKKKPATVNQSTGDTDARQDMTKEGLEISLSTIDSASVLAFGTLTIGLQHAGDKNVYPMVHVYLVFLLSIIKIEKAFVLFEEDIPWRNMASFLNALTKLNTKTSKVFETNFPRPDEGIDRPLPEDFVMRGQLWSEFYFPDTWFSNAAIDEEERTFELSSMLQPRIERILWLGHRIATSGQRLSYDRNSRLFTANPSL